ncbi:Putative Vacuolar ATPase assembly integral membrane protein VMA21 [Aspergillus calidoustus]|uniref:Putative Vacuolar ATPase assembly integral membrane protein VMA21 n=1 Tax=Aspergillus calidoustus TaxID=454130 RepID=A0A0U5G5J1_ASPCI|nr:Putative Vacuolar ATPase assembly integral membrane protein VMA21 [Aspergillus calidoustus]
MATRRPGKSYAEAAVAPSPGEKIAEGDSDTSPAVPMHVIWKLVGFTAAMITTPVGTYFVSVSFASSTTVAAILAAVMANIILFLYVYVAWQEDKEEREAEAARRKGRKAQ